MTQFSDRVVADEVNANFLTGYRQPLLIDDSVQIDRLVRMELETISKDGTFNVYLQRPAQSYIAYLSEGDLLARGLLDQPEDIGTYYIRTLFRGRPNVKGLNEYETNYETSYDWILADPFDELVFSAKLRFMNVSSDAVRMVVDTRSEIHTYQPRKGEYGVNWSMTPVSGIEPVPVGSAPTIPSQDPSFPLVQEMPGTSTVPRVFTLQPGSYLAIDGFFTPKVLYVEDYRVVDTDIHDNELAFAKRFNAF